MSNSSLRAALPLTLLLAAALGLDGQPPRRLTSHITIMTMDGKSKRVVYSAARKFEAPNWSPDGKYLLLNSEGKLWRLPLGGGEPEAVATGTVRGINNDH